MTLVFTLHRTFGMMILPILLLVGILYLAFMKNPHPAVGRVLAVLVDIQVALGLVWLVVSLTGGRAFSPIVWAHLVLAVLAAGVGHMAVKNVGPLKRLGEKGPAAGLAIALVLILLNIPLGLQV